MDAASIGEGTPSPGDANQAQIVFGDLKGIDSVGLVGGAVAQNEPSTTAPRGKSQEWIRLGSVEVMVRILGGVDGRGVARQMQRLIDLVIVAESALGGNG